MHKKKLFSGILNVFKLLELKLITKILFLIIKHFFGTFLSTIKAK